MMEWRRCTGCPTSPPLGESRRFWVLVVSAVPRPSLVTVGKKEQGKISNDTLIIKVNLLNKLSLTFSISWKYIYL